MKKATIYLQLAMACMQFHPRFLIICVPCIFCTHLLNFHPFAFTGEFDRNLYNLKHIKVAHSHTCVHHGIRYGIGVQLASFPVEGPNHSRDNPRNCPVLCVRWDLQAHMASPGSIKNPWTEVSGGDMALGVLLRGHQSEKTEAGHPPRAASEGIWACCPNQPR